MNSWTTRVLVEGKKRLFKEDFNFLIEIFTTPEVELLAAAQEEWRKDDEAYFRYLNSQIAEFNKLYLQHFDKPLDRRINALVIKNLENEKEVVDARLCQYPANRRSVRYRLAGNTAAPGQA